MKIERFEDLDCWKKARELVNLVYDATGQGLFSKDFGLRDQIQRASVSVMANISEGFGTRSNQEFARFLDYSIRSCFEVQSHLYAALDRNYIEKKVFDQIYSKVSDCVNLCKGFIRYLKEANL